MLVDDFWQIVELARSDAGVTDDRLSGDAVATALTERLAALPLDEILDFDEQYHEVIRRLQQWELCAACFLITGYISDDTFTDFKAGVIAMGRNAFERIAADPDAALAEHPTVVNIAAGQLKRTVLNGERLQSAASRAYTRLSDDDDEAFWDAAHARQEGRPRQPRSTDWDGRFGAPGDREMLPARVPRLAAMFPLSTTQT
jgi:hypothetical protein